MTKKSEDDTMDKKKMNATVKKNNKIKLVPGVTEFKLCDIHPAKYNPRTITDDAMAGLAASTEKFGCVVPIIVNVRDNKNIIVGGHQRYKYLLSRGVVSTGCVTVDLNDNDEKLLNVSLNNPNTQGQFIEGISEYIERLQNGIGDSSDLINLRIDQLKADIEAAGEGLAGDDDAPEISDKTDSQVGDRWRLGDHELICGSCTDAEVLARWFDDKIKLVFTDPPYNMNYQSKTLGGIKNDHMAAAAFVRLILESAKMIERVLATGGSYYICMSAAEYPTVYHQLRKLGLKGRQIIWCKPSLGMGAQEYRPRFEVMLYGYTGARADRTWNGKRRCSDLWEFDAGRGVTTRFEDDNTIVEIGSGIETTAIIIPGKMKGTVVHFDGGIDDLWKFSRASGVYVHPTQKPVELIARAIRNSSNPGDTVADLFGGSGSTLIACEKTKRLCRMVELDPKYCDVIIKRWEQWTGNKAKKLKG